MFVYNITIKVDNQITGEWLQWQKEIHIPEILSTGFFYDFRFYELLEQDNSEGRTFVIQFFAMEQQHHNEYMHNHARQFGEKEFKKWGYQFISFTTLLKSVH